MSGINEDCWSGFLLINPFLGKRISLNYTPDLFYLVITGKPIIPDSTIEPERRMELDGLLVTLGYDKGVTWEIRDWDLTAWFLTYIEDDTPKKIT